MRKAGVSMVQTKPQAMQDAICGKVHLVFFKNRLKKNLKNHVNQSNYTREDWRNVPPGFKAEVRKSNVFFRFTVGLLSSHLDVLLLLHSHPSFSCCPRTMLLKGEMSHPFRLLSGLGCHFTTMCHIDVSYPYITFLWLCSI